MGLLAAIGLGVAFAGLAMWAVLRGNVRRGAPDARALPGGDARDALGRDPGEAAAPPTWATALVATAWHHSPAHADEAGDRALAAGMAEVLKRFSAEPRRLPRRPHLLPQLLAVLGDERAGAREVAAVIAQDPTLAANVLRLANSARYRVRVEPVEGIERAVALVGTQGIRQVASVALMQPVVPPDGAVLGRLPTVLWDYTQDAARAAAAIASARGVDPFAAQLVALLHGLGAQVTLQVLRDQLQRPGTPMPGVAQTGALLEHWAPRIACLVARQWALSERVTDALDPDASLRAVELRVVLALALDHATHSRGASESMSPAPSAAVAEIDAHS